MHVLSCNTLSLTIDARGRVTSLRHRESGYEFLSAPAPPVGLWQLGLIHPVTYTDPLPPIHSPSLPYEGHKWWANRNEYRADLELDSDELPPSEMAGDDGALTLRWCASIPEGQAEITLTVRAEGDYLAWTCRVALPPSWAVKRVTYPRIRGLGDVAAPEEDALLAPSGWGVLRRNPLEDRTAVTGQYPGSANWCRMLAWLHGEHGLYLGIHDPEVNHVGLDAQYVEGDAPAPWHLERWHLPAADVPAREEAPALPLTERLAAGARPGLQVRCSHWPAMAPTWESPYPTLLQGFTGDWFTAAALQREWAVRQRWCRRGRLADREDASPALTGLDLWFIRFGFPAWSHEPTPAWAFRDTMHALRDSFDMPFGIHWYHWHAFNWHTGFPAHAPAVEGFAEVVRDLQARGIVVMPYCQGRLLYRDRPHFDEERTHASVEANGQPYLEMYTGQDDWPLALCPGDAWSRAQWCEAARMLWQDCGVDGVYFDQIAAMPPSLCYHAGHGHPPGGGTQYWAGYDAALEAMQDLRAGHPGRFLASELLVDAYLDRFDAFLSFVPPLEDQVPLYTAIYGGYTIILGRSTPAAVMADPQLFLLCQGEQLLFGGQLGWTNDSILQHPQAARCLRELARLRSRIREFLQLGTMLAPLPLDQEARIALTLPGQLCGRAQPLAIRRPAVRHTAWQAPDGRRLVLLLNESMQPATATIRPPGDWPREGWHWWRLGEERPERRDLPPVTKIDMPPLSALAILNA